LRVPDLADHLSRVEQGINRTLLSDNRYLSQPIRRLLRGRRAKQLRPSLLIAIVIGQGQQINDLVITGCVAVELVHIASLVHDDVIDTADERWGIPTINGHEGVNRAIVVGDYLLAKACLQAAAISAPAAKIIASTIAALCDGQTRELADKGNTDRSKAAYLAAVSGKTAALLSAVCQLGGMCAGLTTSQMSALARFGQDFGMAFQIVDDILDLVSTPALSGKPVGQDLSAGIYTLPLLFALAGSSGDTLRILLKDYQPHDQSAIIDILLRDSSIEKAIQIAQKYSQSSIQALQNLGGSSAINLINLPNAYLNWALKQAVAGSYRPAIAKILP